MKLFGLIALSGAMGFQFEDLTNHNRQRGASSKPTVSGRFRSAHRESDQFNETDSRQKVRRCDTNADGFISRAEYSQCQGNKNYTKRHFISAHPENQHKEGAFRKPVNGRYRNAHFDNDSNENDFRPRMEVPSFKRCDINADGFVSRSEFNRCHKHDDEHFDDIRNENQRASFQKPVHDHYHDTDFNENNARDFNRHYNRHFATASQGTTNENTDYRSFLESCDRNGDGSLSRFEFARCGSEMWHPEQQKWFEFANEKSMPFEFEYDPMDFAYNFARNMDNIDRDDSSMPLDESEFAWQFMNALSNLRGNELKLFQDRAVRCANGSRSGCDDFFNRVTKMFSQPRANHDADEFDFPKYNSRTNNFPNYGY